MSIIVPLICLYQQNNFNRYFIVNAKQIQIQIFWSAGQLELHLILLEKLNADMRDTM